jgi:hypothetical protein
MAAHLVHHHHHAAGAPGRIQRGDALVQVLEHDLVQTLAAAAQAGSSSVRVSTWFDALAQPLQPDWLSSHKHRQPGALQHIQQVLKRWFEAS